MRTVYDWVTVAMFAGLVVLFLQRSSKEEPSDRLWQYFPPAIGCAFANYLGNEGHDIAAVATLAVTLGYIFYVLKPHRAAGN